jgi:hypothetical protein
VTFSDGSRWKLQGEWSNVAYADGSGYPIWWDSRLASEVAKHSPALPHKTSQLRRRLARESAIRQHGDNLEMRRPALLARHDISPPVYSMVGSQRVDFTTTAHCPDKDDVVTPFNGFVVDLVSGSGPFSADQATLSGHTDDGVIESTWNFTRP